MNALELYAILGETYALLRKAQSDLKEAQETNARLAAEVRELQRELQEEAHASQEGQV